MNCRKRNGFPRKLRLTNQAQYKRVFDKKQKIFAEPFAIYYRANDLAHPRLGVGVAKKNVGKSSQRNYFKRIIKEEFRLNQHGIKNTDVLVFVRSGAEKIPQKEARLRLKQQMERLSL